MSDVGVLPCPFCGLDDTYLVRPDAISRTALVGCNTCGSIGPVTYAQSIDEAIDAWNRRPTDALAVAGKPIPEDCVFLLDL